MSFGVPSYNWTKMAAKPRKVPCASAAFCMDEIDRMLKYSQTKVIMPIVTLGLLQVFLQKEQLIFTDSEVKKAYEAAVRHMKAYLGHDVHVGARYYDAYGTRMPRYSVLKSVGHLKYELQSPYTTFAATLCDWIPTRIRAHIDERLGVVPLLSDPVTRLNYAQSSEAFCGLIREQIGKTPANFEIFSFAVIKVHLE